MHSDSPHRLKQEVAAAVRAEVGDAAVLVYLFGSQLSGAVHAESDVDVAVLADHAFAAEDYLALQSHVAERVGASVDLVDLHRASTVMRMQVVTTGALVYARSPAEQGHFETYVFSSYAALNEERSAILKDIRRCGQVYGG